jgi:hypothetical protein
VEVGWGSRVVLGGAGASDDEQSPQVFQLGCCESSDWPVGG